MSGYRARYDPDNLSILSAASLAPSYHSTLPSGDTTLIPPHYRSYRSGEPRLRRSTTSAASTLQLTAQHTSSGSAIDPVNGSPSLSVYSIPGFHTFNHVPRNEAALERIAQRRYSESLESTLKQFSINHERQQLGVGSSKNHPMLAPRRASATARSGSLPVVDEGGVGGGSGSGDRCPLELDNEVWDYGMMCSGSYPSLEYYQRRAREITRYEEREAIIKEAHQRLCVGRDRSDSATTAASEVADGSELSRSL